MKTLATVLLLLSALTARGQIVDISRKPAQKTAVQQDSLLRHVVLFKFREGIPADTLQNIERAFYSLPGKIPEIRDFEWGLNNSPEGLEKGFTHCFLLTFASEEDRAVYLPHPAHKAFGALISPWLEDVLVVDYWAVGPH